MTEYNTFDKIENNDQAYLIGYLCGDGGVLNKKDKRATRMSVSSTDLETIKYLSDNFCSGVTVSRDFKNNSKRKIYAKLPDYSFTFPSKFEETFKKYGVLDYKKDRKLVNISKRNMRPYLLGLIDADGCITFGKRKDRDRLWGKINITHQSTDVLYKIQKFLEEDLGISSRVAPKGLEKCYVLEFSKLDNVEKFCKYLYDKEYNGYYLERKHEKATQFCHLIGLKRESYSHKVS